MARTRNSDPGRAPALHYAATPGQRHAKRIVYAYLALAGLGAAVWSTGLGTACAQDRALGAEVLAKAAVPCVACQTLSLEPNQVSVLPDRLSGARVLVRVLRGADSAG